MKQFMVNLADVERFRDPSRKLTTAQLVKPVELKPDEGDPKTMLVYYDGEPVGALPRKGNLCKLVLAGAKIGHASWQSFGAADSEGYPLGLRIRVVLVDEGEHFEMPPPAPPHVYHVGLVGEANYQSSIRLCSTGQQVHIVQEVGNPYDEHALAVVTEDGSTIGYIARDSWLQRTVHEEGKGCEATIKGIQTGGKGMAGVVLDISLNGLGVRQRPFLRAPLPSPAATKDEPRNGFLARLFGL